MWHDWTAIVGASFLVTGIVTVGVAVLGLLTFDLHSWLYGPGMAFAYCGVAFTSIGAAVFLIGRLFSE